MVGCSVWHPINPVNSAAAITLSITYAPLFDVTARPNGATDDGDCRCLFGLQEFGPDLRIVAFDQKSTIYARQALYKQIFIAPEQEDITGGFALAQVDQDDVAIPDRRLHAVAAHRQQGGVVGAVGVVARRAFAVAHGADWDDAFRAITLTPAEIYGVGDQFGALAPGYVADVVVWDGDPLEVMSSPVAVLIDGEVTPLDSRQSRLRDRYINLPDETPFAYRR